MIIALCVLACIVVFLAIAFVALYVQIVRPMRERMTAIQTKQAEQEDTIARNARASVGLYFFNRHETNAIAHVLYSQGQKIAFVESCLDAKVDPLLLACDDAPITSRDIESCPNTKRSNR